MTKWKRKKEKKPKKEKIMTWRRKCDKAFAHFIRNRDSETEWVCISCWEVFPYEWMDAGHFIWRKCIRLRYNEYNVNSQCRRCNRFGHWEQALYYKWIIKKYWKEKADELLKIYIEESKKKTSYPVEWYKPIYKKYEKYK